MDAEGATDIAAGQHSGRQDYTSNIIDMPIPEGHEFTGVQGIHSSPMVGSALLLSSLMFGSRCACFVSCPYEVARPAML